MITLANMFTDMDVKPKVCDSLTGFCFHFKVVGSSGDHKSVTSSAGLYVLLGATAGPLNYGNKLYAHKMSPVS